MEQGHVDQGSCLSLSALLSKATAGGDFITHDSAGNAEEHRLVEGDAILFTSDTVHNVTTVGEGVRRSLVIELWQAEPTRTDRDR